MKKNSTQNTISQFHCPNVPKTEIFDQILNGNSKSRQAYKIQIFWELADAFLYQSFLKEITEIVFITKSEKGK